MYRKDNTEEVKGGILIYIKNELAQNTCYPKSKKLSNMCAEFKECILLEIGISEEKVLFGTFYRKGSSNSENNNMLREIITRSSDEYDIILFCGDFNFPTIKWKENTIVDTTFSQPMRFYNCLQDNFLKQHVCEFTRARGTQNPSLLDLIVTEDTQLQVKPSLSICAPLGKSDHAVLQWKYLVSIEDKEPDDEKTAAPRYNYYKGNYGEFRDLLSNIDWEERLKGKNNVNSILETLLMEVNKCKEATIPLCTDKTRNKKQPWMNVAALRSLKKKHYAWKRFTQTKSHHSYQQYVKERNRTTKKLRKVKRIFEKKLVKDCKVNPKAFYRYCNFKSRKKTNYIRLYNNDAMTSYATNDNENATILNNFFADVFTKESDSPELILNAASKWLYGENGESVDPFTYNGPTADKQNIDTIEITEDDIYELLQGLDTTKSSASDCVHPRLLKEGAKYLARPIAILFRHSLSSGMVPDKWKSVVVTPIHKGEDRHAARNYRPITITSVLCRLLEKIVKKTVMDHFTESNVLPKQQHGFVNRKSCLTNLLETMEDITKWQDLGIPVDEIYLDFAKAFDKVPHQRLLFKLKKLGINDTLLTWIESFLSSRRQSVKVRNSLSDPTLVTSGVPQGSVLGPLLFIAYISDLPSIITSSSKIFADDTKLYRKIESINDSEQLQQDLDSLSEWCITWGMVFNTSKCVVMHYGKDNHNYLYHIQGKLLDPCSTYKDLGVMISSNLKPEEQISRCIAKANCMVGMIRRTFTYIDSDIFLKTYKTFVRPILEYCQEVWSPFLQKDITDIENVQRRATKIVPGFSEMTYEERLDKLKLFKLEDRRQRGDLIFLYKIFHGLVDIDHQRLFTLNNRGTTRGHCFKLKEDRSNKDTRRYFYTQRVVVPWNNLPQHIVQSPSVTLFKRNYDEYVLNKGKRSQNLYR